MSSTLPPLVQACSGALASATANTVSYPFDLVATKVQTSRSKQQSHGEYISQREMNTNPWLRIKGCPTNLEARLRDPRNFRALQRPGDGYWSHHPLQVRQNYA